MPLISGGGGSGVVASIAAADTSIVVAGTSTVPTVRTGTLDVIAADHAPAADWSNNSHKITGLANASAASDAAAYGQVPLAGITITNSPAAGKVLTATDASNLSWATPTSTMVRIFDSALGAPAANIDTGAAGISGSYRHLLFLLYLRSVKNATTDTVLLTFNNDSTGIYYQEFVRAFSTSAGAVQSLATAGFVLDTIPAATASAGVFSPITITVPNYAGSGVKAINGQAGYTFDFAATHVETGNLIGFYNSVTAISRAAIASTSNLDTGSSMTIYGLP